MRTGGAVRLGLSVVVSVGCLLLAIRNINPEQVLAALAASNYTWLVPALLALAATMVAKAIRWRLMFRPHASARLSPFLSALLVGYMANSILPARLGEVVRIYLVGQVPGLSRARALSTVLVEKLLDIGTLLAILAVLGLAVRLEPWTRSMGYAAGVALGIGVLLLGSVAVRPELARVLLGQIVRRLPVVGQQSRALLTRQIDLILDGLRLLTDRRACLPLFGWSLVVWLTGAAVNYFILRALGIEPALPAAFLTLVVTNLGMAAPSTPGYVGVFHYLSVLSLQTFAVAGDAALGYALIAHAIIFGSFILAGLACLWWQNLSLRGLLAEAST